MAPSSLCGRPLTPHWVGWHQSLVREMGVWHFHVAEGRVPTSSQEGRMSWGATMSAPSWHLENAKEGNYWLLDLNRHAGVAKRALCGVNWRADFTSKDLRPEGLVLGSTSGFCAWGRLSPTQAWVSPGTTFSTPSHHNPAYCRAGGTVGSQIHRQLYLESQDIFPLPPTFSLPEINLFLFPRSTSKLPSKSCSPSHSQSG